MSKCRERTRAELEALSLAALRQVAGCESVTAVEVKAIASRTPPTWRLARTTPPLSPQQWLDAFDAVQPLTFKYLLVAERRETARPSRSAA